MASGRPASLPSPCPRRAYLDSLCPPGGPGRAFRRQLGPSLESNPCPTANASGRPAAGEFPTGARIQKNVAIKKKKRSFCDDGESGNCCADGDNCNNNNGSSSCLTCVLRGRGKKKVTRCLTDSLFPHGYVSVSTDRHGHSYNARCEKRERNSKHHPQNNEQH